MSRVDTAKAPTGAPAAAPAAEPGPATAAASAAPAAQLGRLRTLTLFRSELALTFLRWRTLALFAILAVIPVVVGIAVKIETSDGGVAGGDDGEGPAFLGQVTNNSLFLVFTSLAVTLPFFLPMAIGVIAGDAVAGEASAGTLRYLLVAPAGRARLLLAKANATVLFCVAAVLVVATSALLTGMALFPVGDVTLLSGTTISFAEGLLRALLVAGVVAASLLGLASVGLFLSTVTNSGIAAMAGTVGVMITVQILNSIPQLDMIHPYLFPHYWLGFVDLVRDPVMWGEVQHNLALQAAYVAVFGSAAWARFTTRDVTA